MLTIHDQQIGLLWDSQDRKGCASRPLNQAWIARFRQLSESRVLCPSDITVRCALAAMFEQLNQHDVAVFHWNAVLLFDPNLKAWEGSARCRQRMVFPLGAR